MNLASGHSAIDPRLLAAIHGGNCVAFVGAGFSAAADLIPSCGPSTSRPIPSIAWGNSCMASGSCGSIPSRPTRRAWG